jgi:hypothetical protein
MHRRPVLATVTALATVIALGAAVAAAPAIDGYCLSYRASGDTSEEPLGPPGSSPPVMFRTTRQVGRASQVGAYAPASSGWTQRRLRNRAKPRSALYQVAPFSTAMAA